VKALLLARRIERECSPPFLPRGFVRVVEVPGSGFTLMVGDRDIQFDESGNVVGAGTAVGPLSAWEIRSK
jgi:hypothetical protein